MASLILPDQNLSLSEPNLTDCRIKDRDGDSIMRASNSIHITPPVGGAHVGLHGFLGDGPTDLRLVLVHAPAILMNLQCTLMCPYEFICFYSL